METGWIKATDEEYFADPRANASTLNEVLKGASYFLNRKRKEAPKSDALFFGSIFHKIFLTEMTLEQGLEAVKTPAKRALLENLSQSLEALEFWRDLKRGFYGPLILEEAGTTRDFKIKPDVRCPQTGLILDLKTTTDVNQFQWSAKKFGYDLQAAHYLDVAHQIDGKEYRDFIFVVIDKSYPFQVKLFNLDEETKARGLEKRNQAFSQWSAWMEDTGLLHQEAQKEEKDIQTLSF